MNYSHFVGLDVGKKTFDASLMSADEKELSHKSFDLISTCLSISFFFSSTNMESYLFK